MCRPRLACPFSHPSRPAVLSCRPAARVVLRFDLSRLIRSSCLPALAPPACRFFIRFAFLPVPRVGGRGVHHLAFISSCVSSVASAFRSSSSRYATLYCVLWRWGPSDVGHSCLGSMSCTSFLWASCVFLLQHGVPFFYFCGSSLLARPVPRVDNRGDVG